MSDSKPLTEPILLTEQHGGARILILNRPESRNALNTSLLNLLRSELAAADEDDETDAVILTGTDPAFCAGLDLRELGDTGIDAVTTTGIPVGHPWLPLSKPVVGAVNGAAITGGFEIALACDFLVASENARFADTHARVGVMPNWGLTARLPAAVGRGFARRMSLSGDFVGAAEALRVGLVTQVVAHENLMTTAVEIASSVAGNDRLGVQTLLASYRRAEEHVLDPALFVEDDTSRQWMRDFVPSRVAERRTKVLDRGRSQIAGTSALPTGTGARRAEPLP
ncbi:enoyl-CoA hydratase [Nocardia carnea]|uniref:enoyl-CoA hydratase n=1 Tax=Nocardia carnea TaxID=37328 RepID=UPI002457FD4C|nr:enoyl-CoA hydratase [Nocardia carnea]